MQVAWLFGIGVVASAACSYWLRRATEKTWSHSVLKRLRDSVVTATVATGICTLVGVVIAALGARIEDSTLEQIEKHSVTFLAMVKACKPGKTTELALYGTALFLALLTPMLGGNIAAKKVKTTFKYIRFAWLFAVTITSFTFFTGTVAASADAVLAARRHQAVLTRDHLRNARRHIRRWIVATSQEQLLALAEARVVVRESTLIDSSASAAVKQFRQTAHPSASDADLAIERYLRDRQRRYDEVARPAYRASDEARPGDQMPELLSSASEGSFTCERARQLSAALEAEAAKAEGKARAIAPEFAPVVDKLSDVALTGALEHPLEAALMAGVGDIQLELADVLAQELVLQPLKEFVRRVADEVIARYALGERVEGCIARLKAATNTYWDEANKGPVLKWAKALPERFEAEKQKLSRLVAAMPAEYQAAGGRRYAEVLERFEQRFALLARIASPRLQTRLLTLKARLLAEVESDADPFSRASALSGIASRMRLNDSTISAWHVKYAAQVEQEKPGRAVGLQVEFDRATTAVSASEAASRAGRARQWALRALREGALASARKKAVAAITEALKQWTDWTDAYVVHYAIEGGDLGKDAWTKPLQRAVQEHPQLVAALGLLVHVRQSAKLELTEEAARSGIDAIELISPGLRELAARTFSGAAVSAFLSVVIPPQWKIRIEDAYGEGTPMAEKLIRLGASAGDAAAIVAVQLRDKPGLALVLLEMFKDKRSLSLLADLVAGCAGASGFDFRDTQTPVEGTAPVVEDLISRLDRKSLDAWSSLSPAARRRAAHEFRRVSDGEHPDVDNDRSAWLADIARNPGAVLLYKTASSAFGYYGRDRLPKLPHIPIDDYLPGGLVPPSKERPEGGTPSQRIRRAEARASTGFPEVGKPLPGFPRPPIERPPEPIEPRPKGRPKIFHK